MTSRRRAVFIVVPAVFLALVAGHYFAGHQTPAGQPPLAELNAKSLEVFKAEFNRASHQVRVVLLLSPT